MPSAKGGDGCRLRELTDNEVCSISSCNSLRIDDCRYEFFARQSRLMGLNNGLIVGYSSLQDGGLYVFDQICPNCYQQNGLASMKYMVDFDSESAGTQVVCPTCKRYYGLINGGVVVKGESGQKLYRYRANFTSNVFRISNPY